VTEYPRRDVAAEVDGVMADGNWSLLQKLDLIRDILPIAARGRKTSLPSGCSPASGRTVERMMAPEQD
jgi:hypothetical protein